MVAIPSRHRSLALLTGVLLLQVLFLAVQVRRDSRGRLIRVWAVGALSPFERGGAWGFGKVGGVWHHYFALQNTAHQNEALKSDNEALKLAIATLQTKADEADRLAAILKFQQSHTGVPTLGARVIGASAGTASLTVEIDRGERDGVKRNMAVITPDGAVGKIIEVYRDNSQVLLLTDPVDAFWTASPPGMRIAVRATGTTLGHGVEPQSADLARYRDVVRNFLARIAT